MVFNEDVHHGCNGSGGTGTRADGGWIGTRRKTTIGEERADDDPADRSMHTGSERHESHLPSHHPQDTDRARNPAKDVQLPLKPIR